MVWTRFKLEIIFTFLLHLLDLFAIFDINKLLLSKSY